LRVSAEFFTAGAILIWKTGEPMLVSIYRRTWLESVSFRARPDRAHPAAHQGSRTETDRSKYLRAMPWETGQSYRPIAVRAPRQTAVRPSRCRTKKSGCFADPEARNRSA